MSCLLSEMRFFRSLCRWVNALDPNIKKGPWTKEDDRKLLEFVEKLGKGESSSLSLCKNLKQMHSVYFVASFKQVNNFTNALSQELAVHPV